MAENFDCVEVEGDIKVLGNNTAEIPSIVREIEAFLAEPIDIVDHNDDKFLTVGPGISTRQAIMTIDTLLNVEPLQRIDVDETITIELTDECEDVDPLSISGEEIAEENEEEPKCINCRKLRIPKKKRLG